MMVDFGHLPRILLAMLLAVAFARASSIGARSPQDPDDDNDGDESGSLHFYTPTPSLAAGAAAPTQTVTFTLGELPDTSVCGQSTITWNYVGPTYYVMALSVMPYFVKDSSDDIPVVIGTLNGGLGIGKYTWSPVNVSEGQYNLNITIPNLSISYISEPFYVANSSDHSCLVGSSSTTPSQPSSTGSPSASTSAGDTSGGATDAPVIGAVSGSSMSRGGIAGVVIGVLAFVGALVAILLLLWRRRASRIMGAPRGGLFEKRRPKGAVSIGSRGGSFSSAHGVPPRGLGSTFGTSAHYNLNDPSNSALGHGISEDDIGTQSFSGEKPLALAPAELGMIPPVHRKPHAYRDSLGSVATSSTTAAGSPINKHLRHSGPLYTSDPFASSPPTPRVSGDYQRSLGNQSQVPVALYHPSSIESTPRTYGSPGVPRDISITSSLPDFDFERDAASPFAAAAAPAISRRAPPPPPVSAPSATQPTRRSTRKPVPVYEPSVAGETLELVEPSTPRSTGTASSYYNSGTAQRSSVSLAQSSGGNDWSSAAAHSHSPPSGASPISSGSYGSYGSGHSLGSLGGHSGLPELNHKSSFGERQMHVIMPDPPPREMQ